MYSDPVLFSALLDRSNYITHMKRLKSRNKWGGSKTRGKNKARLSIERELFRMVHAPSRGHDKSGSSFHFDRRRSDAAYTGYIPFNI
jgi:hypothetical protein